MPHRLWLGLMLGLLVLTGCKQVTEIPDQELMLLKKWMIGSFSSQEQAATDTNYFDIRLHMVEMWPDHPEAIWLYVEQAAAWSLDRPYRQRVYRLSRVDETHFESAVYSLETPLRFAGVWQSATPLASLTPDSLTAREGCAIVLEQQGAAFVGSTVEKLCQSSLRGAAYATSEVRIEENMLTSWDRGFDSEDEQVWGAQNGPYIFRKITPQQ